MPKTQHLGNKLAFAIEAKGDVSQADVARAFGVTPSTVNGDWLKHGRIAKRHYPKLVSYFGLPYEWWFGEEQIDQKFKALIIIHANMTEQERNELMQAALLIKKRGGGRRPTIKKIRPGRSAQSA